MERSNCEQETTYARAMAMLALNEKAALALLEQAYIEFDSAHQCDRQLVAAAAAVTAFQTSWCCFRDFDVWVSRLVSHLTHEDRLTTPLERVRVHCAVIGACLISDHPPLDADRRSLRLSQALDLVFAHGHEFEVNELFIVLRLLLDFLEIDNRAERFEPLLLLLNSRRESPDLKPLLLGRALVHAARCFLRFNLLQRNERYSAKAKACWEDAQQLADAHQLTTLGFDVAHSRVGQAVIHGDLSEVKQLLDSMEAYISTEEPTRLSEYLLERTRRALLDRDDQLALALSSDCMQAIEAAALPIRQRGAQVLFRASALVMAGRHDAALEIVSGYVVFTDGRQRQVLECIMAFLRALSMRDQDRSSPEYRDRLDIALGHAEALKLPTFFASMPHIAAEVCADALQFGIHVDFVRGVVAQRRLPAPPELLSEWPWPLAISTFGGLSLLHDGVPLSFTGKLQKRPLELLQCVAASGPLGIDADTLAEQLWPEIDGDAAR